MKSRLIKSCVMCAAIGMIGCRSSHYADQKDAFYSIPDSKYYSIHESSVEVMLKYEEGHHDVLISSMKAVREHVAKKYDNKEVLNIIDEHIKLVKEKSARVWGMRRKDLIDLRNGLGDRDRLFLFEYEDNSGAYEDGIMVLRDGEIVLGGADEIGGEELEAVDHDMSKLFQMPGKKWSTH